eukprot:960959-Alexandrium_andersonii.AAC.1
MDAAKAAGLASLFPGNQVGAGLRHSGIHAGQTRWRPQLGSPPEAPVATSVDRRGHGRSGRAPSPR